jgi:hypothetical protein
VDNEKVFTALVRHMPGHWTSGKNASQRGVIVDVCAGMICARRADGTLVMGDPSDFVAESGESGDALLSHLMPWPTWRSLFYGAVRESLAAAHSTAEDGVQDTHAWETPIRYVADDNQGNVGIIAFTADGAVAAISSRAPRRRFDYAQAIEAAPSDLKSAVATLCDLPRLSEGPGVTAVFWTAGEFIHGPEAWHSIYQFGAELFRRELLPNWAWETEGATHYSHTTPIAHLAITASSRARIRVPLLILSEKEFRQLIPHRSPYEREATDLLLSDQLFEIATDASG